MIASPAPPPKSTTVVEEDLGLAELLDLFDTGDARRRRRDWLVAAGSRLAARTRRLVRRAAEWGSGPQGAFRAW